MLIRLLENFLISTFNRRLDRRQEQAPAPPAPPPVLPADYTILGHIISEPEEGAGSQAPTQNPDGEVVALSPEVRRRHLYILGATGTGKTNLLLRLIESDIANGRAFCVIDLRGDLVDRIMLRLAAAAPPESWRERLFLLDLRRGEHAVGFNPLAGEGEVYARALHVLSVLKAQSDSWGVQLEETLRNCLLALAETGWTLLEVEPLLTSAPFRAEVLRGVSDARVRSFFDRYGHLSPANQTTWALAVLNKITPLLSIPSLRLLFGQRQGFSLETLLERQPGMVVLVSLAVDRLHDAARLTGGLLVSSFQTAIMSRVDVPENRRVPLNLYIDEFESMASDRFEAIVAEGRRFGLGLTLSHQNVSQLDTKLRHVLRNNVHTQVYFQTGALDAAELSREIGGGRSGDEVRQILMSQGVGQAYLVRRGQSSARMQVLHSPDPRVPEERVEAVRQAALSSYARPRAEVEAELAERERRFGPPASTSASSGDDVPEARPTYEIRHSKTATFEPEPPASDAAPSARPRPKHAPARPPRSQKPSGTRDNDDADQP